MERFPIQLVREPTAFTSNDPKEIYNNILIYIVGARPEESPTPAEMHIFQCVNVRSRDVVEDLKHFMSGASKRGGGRGGGRHTPDYPEIKMGDLLMLFRPILGQGGTEEDPKINKNMKQAKRKQTRR